MISDLGERVRAALVGVGHTQTSFARIASTSNGYVSEICRGQKRPSIEVLAALVALGVDGTWLLTGEGVMLRQRDPVTLEPQTQPLPSLGSAPTMEAADELDDAVHRLRRRDVAGKLATRVAAYVHGLLDAQGEERLHRAAG